MDHIKTYLGRVPACGCFCGGCPNYLREKKPCPGAAYTDRCEGCKSYHLCCQDKGIEHCWRCGEFPCRRFRGFRDRWLKYGQDFLENQQLIKEQGVGAFLRFWNDQAE